MLRMIECRKLNLHKCDRLVLLLSILQKIGQRLKHIGTVGNKKPVKIEETEKFPQFPETRRDRKLTNVCHFVIKGANAMLIYRVAEEGK